MAPTHLVCTCSCCLNSVISVQYRAALYRTLGWLMCAVAFPESTYCTGIGICMMLVGYVHGMRLAWCNLVFYGMGLIMANSSCTVRLK